MEELNMAKAQEVFDLLCRTLDNRGLRYDKIEEDLMIKSVVNGEDIPIHFYMRVNPRNELVSFISWLPFKVQEDKRLDMALAICATNYGFADGCFDYNIEDGTIIFRLTSSYKDSMLSEALIDYMFMLSALTVDSYNDKYLMISKGLMTVQQFIELEKKQ